MNGLLRNINSLCAQTMLDRVYLQSGCAKYHCDWEAVLSVDPSLGIAGVVV